MIKEHQEGCMCDSCQGMDPNGSYELTSDPHQELNPNQLQDPTFINSVITQVLQQLQDGGLEEQQAANQIKTQAVPQDVTYNGTNAQQQITGLDHWANDVLHTKYIKDPCGGHNQQAHIMNVLQKADAISNPSNTGILEPIKTKTDSKTLGEGSCGYGPNGVPGNTPGETIGMSAYDRTQQLIKKFIHKEVRKIQEQGMEIDDDIIYRVGDKVSVLMRGTKAEDHQDAIITSIDTEDGVLRKTSKRDTLLSVYSEEEDLEDEVSTYDIRFYGFKDEDSDDKGNLIKLQQMMGKEVDEQGLDQIERGINTVTGGGRQSASVSDRGDEIRVKFSHMRADFENEEWETILDYVSDNMGYEISDESNNYEPNYDKGEPAEASPTIYLKKQ